MQAWQDAWWAAEAAEADRKLDMLWEAEVAWQPALLVWDVLDDSANGSAGCGTCACLALTI